jgi:hypothetical protein
VAMAVVREPGLGADWESAGPGITRTRAPVVARVPVGSEVEVSGPVAGLYGTMPILLRPAGEVLTLGGADGLESAVGFTAVPPVTGRGLSGSWCIKAGGCACPSGDRGVDLRVGAPGPVGVALAQPDDREGEYKVTARAQTLDDWCAGEPLDLKKLCDLLTPAEVAGAIGDPSATRGELGIMSKRQAFCAYPKNDGFQALTLNGIRSKNLAADFARAKAALPGVKEVPVAVGNEGYLIMHGTTGNDLYVLVPGGYLILQSGKTSPPSPIPLDWVDERLGAALAALGTIAATRVGRV